MFLPVSFFILAVVQGTTSALQQIAILEQPKDAFKWIQAAYVLPHFSYGVLVLDFFSTGLAPKLLGVNPIYAWISLALSIPCYIAIYVYLD